MNTMKTMSVFVMAVLMMSFLTIGVAAEETEVEVEEAGITPDSPLYGLDRLMENMRLGLTFNKQKKAERALMIAEERMAEAGEMVEMGKREKAQTAMNHHERYMEKARTAMEGIESNGNEKTAQMALKKMAMIQNHVEAHTEKIEAVKNRILEKHQDSMTEEQLAHLEEVFGKIQEKASEMEQKAMQKRDNIKTRYKVLTGKTDAEVEADVAEVEAELMKKRAERTERKEVRTANMTKLQDKIRERKAIHMTGETDETEVETESEADDDANGNTPEETGSTSQQQGQA